MLDLGKAAFVFPCVWLCLLHAAVLSADFLAPYHPAEQRREVPFIAITPVHFLDPDSYSPVQPFVCRSVPRSENSSEYVEDCKKRFPIRWLVQRGAEPGSSERTWRLFGVDEPAGVHLLGTDQYGRDQFSRFLHGGRLSLMAGLLACGLAIGWGSVVGALAGFYGGVVDGAVMWMSEVFLALPWLFLLFALRAFLPLNLQPATAFLAIIVVIGMVGWAKPARLVRNSVLALKEREYVLAARGLGATDSYLLRRHIAPALSGVILTQAALLAPRYVLAEISLSFFGLGVNAPAASWGQMLGSAIEYYTVAPHSVWMYAPVISLVLTCYSYLVLAEFARVRFTSN